MSYPYVIPSEARYRLEISLLKIEQFNLWERTPSMVLAGFIRRGFRSPEIYLRVTRIAEALQPPYASRITY